MVTGTVDEGAVEPRSHGTSWCLCPARLTLARLCKGWNIFQRGSGIHYTPGAKHEQRRSPHARQSMPSPPPVTSASLRTHQGRMLRTADRPGLGGQWVNCSARRLETHHPAHFSPFFNVVLSELPGAANKTSLFLSGAAS